PDAWLPGAGKSGPTRWRRLAAGCRNLLAWPICDAVAAAPSSPPGWVSNIAIVYRYIREAVELRAVLAPTLAEATCTARTTTFVILDGTLLPIGRIAATPRTTQASTNATGRTSRSSLKGWRLLPTLRCG